MGASVTPIPASNLQYGPLTVGTSQFGPTQNLIGTQFTPQLSSGTQTAQQDVLNQLQGVQNAPSVQDQFNALANQSNPIFQQNLRTVGQDAAKYGRIGSGLTTSQLGDVASNYNQYLANTAAQLAPQQFQQQLVALGASQSALGQLAGIDQTQYQNLLGERAYQQDLSQQAFNNNLAQTGQELGYSGLGTNPNAGIQDISNQYAQAGAGNLASGGNILAGVLQNGIKWPGSGGSPYPAVTEQNGYY